MSKLKRIFSYFKEAYQEWQKDKAFQKSASLAYYAVLSLPALLVMIINIASVVFSQDYVQQELTAQIGSMMGQESARQVETMITNSRQHGSSTWAIIAGVGMLIFSATGVFYQLQQALNDAWEVEPNPDTGVKQMVISRATALGVVLALAFMLIVSLVLSAGISAVGNWLQQQIPAIPSAVFFIAQSLVSLGLITLLFALMFKVLPDAKIEWKSVWVGALLSAVLFTVGKFLIGLYLGKTDPASTFGAAGSIVLIMLWVYYSSLIVLYGAEYTQVYARHNGHRLEPSEHARRNAEYRLRQYEHNGKPKSDAAAASEKHTDTAPYLREEA